MTAQAKITWFGGKQFVGVDSSKHSVVMSSQDEENGTGMIPPDMLLVALGGCTGMGVSDILLKKKLDLQGLEININGEQREERPSYFEVIEIEYIVKGQDIPEKAVKDAIKISLTKYCSVSATLEGKTEIKTKFQIIE